MFIQLPMSQGMVCSAGQMCETDPADTSYSEAFEAVAGLPIAMTAHVVSPTGMLE